MRISLHDIIQPLENYPWALMRVLRKTAISNEVCVNMVKIYEMTLVPIQDKYPCFL